MGNSGSSLQTCLNNVCNGSSLCVSYPSNPLYQLSWVKPYNLADEVTPAAVIRPQTAADVSAIVKCATANNVKIQAKSGGHSYANYGLGGTNGVLSIDMSNFQEFSMDNSTWQATIGAGTLLGDVTTRLHDAGGRAIAHGTCPGVGMGGHATIGGIGPASRMWGTTLDQVVEVEVVTADGNIQRASETENSDLFWALRGAGAGFGVITEFVVETHPEPGSVVQFTYTFSFGTQADMAPTFTAWQTLISDPNLDRRFASEFIMEPLGCIITGTFYGTQAEFNATGLQGRLPSGGTFSITVNDWLASVTQEAENEALYLSNTPVEFYSKNFAFTLKDAIPASNVTDLFTWIDNASKGTLLWFMIFDVEGGAINDVAQNATAYPHRDKFMFYQSYAIGLPLSQTTKNFLTDFQNQLVAPLPAQPGEADAYAGYVDPDLTNPQQDYWGPNLPRLEQIKSKWDPTDLFHNPQSVRPAASAVVPGTNGTSNGTSSSNGTSASNGTSSSNGTKSDASVSYMAGRGSSIVRHLYLGVLCIMYLLL